MGTKRFWLKAAFQFVTCLLGGVLWMFAFHNVSGVTVLTLSGLGLLIGMFVAMMVACAVAGFVAMVAVRITMNVLADRFLSDDSWLLGHLFRLDQWMDSKQSSGFVASASMLLGVFAGFMLTAYIWPDHVVVLRWTAAAIWTCVLVGPALVTSLLEKRLFPKPKEVDVVVVE